MSLMLPRYPVFVPSKGRADRCLTARFLTQDRVPFRLVVEPAEESTYREHWPEAELMVTPHDQMGLLGVRNHIRDVAEAEGWERHWQVDDNITMVLRLYRGRRVPAHSGVALRVCEDFTDRYSNIGVSGLNYEMFVKDFERRPFYLNCHVYSCSLIWHGMPYRWRAVYNDDTDLCLQVLSGGLCTVALNAFMAKKTRTGIVKGGNTDQLYQGDGRARMARSLERLWPHVVSTQRRYGRPQHVIRDQWRGFDTPLIRRPEVDWGNLPRVDEYGLTLTQVGEEVRDPVLRGWLQQQ